MRGYEDREIFISFSGGKDSTVVADLVKRATGRADICHLFGDTTLEFPETYNYIKEYKEYNYYLSVYLLQELEPTSAFLLQCGELLPQTPDA